MALPRGSVCQLGGGFNQHFDLLRRFAEGRFLPIKILAGVPVRVIMGFFGHITHIRKGMCLKGFEVFGALAKDRFVHGAAWREIISYVRY